MGGGWLDLPEAPGEPAGRSVWLQKRYQHAGRARWQQRLEAAAFWLTRSRRARTSAHCRPCRPTLAAYERAAPSRSRALRKAQACRALTGKAVPLPRGALLRPWFKSTQHRALRSRWMMHRAWRWATALLSCPPMCCRRSSRVTASLWSASCSGASRYARKHLWVSRTRWLSACFSEQQIMPQAPTGQPRPISRLGCALAGLAGLLFVLQRHES